MPEFPRRLTHAHAGGAIHNHIHYTVAGKAETMHSHRYSARGAWEGCACAHCTMIRARRERLAAQ